MMYNTTIEIVNNITILIKRRINMENNNVKLWCSASNLLQVAARRNALLNESKDVVDRYIKQKIEYDDIIKKVQDFVKKHTDSTIQSSSLLFISAVKTKLQDLSEEADKQKRNYELAGELTFRIEEMKKEIFELWKSSPIEKIKTEEIPQEKLRKLVLIVLVINHKHHTFTEENLFESVADFHEILQLSNDPVLTDLVYKGSITNNTLDDYLEKIS